MLGVWVLEGVRVRAVSGGPWRSEYGVLEGVRVRAGSVGP